MLDEERLRAHHLEITYGLGRFMVEHLVRVHRAFEGETFDELAKRGVHLELVRPCNAMSVSTSTGIPRETVRRKIRWLIEKGWVRQVERDKLLVTPHVGRYFADFDRETLERFHRTASEISRLVEPIAPRRRGTAK